MGTPRPSDSGRVDAVGRPIKVSAAGTDARSTAPAPPPTVAAPSFGDDGWDYHRNGIGGLPFLVAGTGDGGLRVSFLEPGPAERFAAPITVPAAMIAHAATQPVSATVGGLGFRMVAADRFGLCVFDTADGGTMVAVTDLDRPDDDYATAVLAVDDVAAGNIGNRWRGDHYHQACLHQIRSHPG